MAGLDVLRLVNEPTAAALAYGLDRAKEGIIAVYDLGGGTFDISILKLNDGIFEVIATNGDTHLGGDDIDNLLLAVALDEIRNEHGVDLRRQPDAIQALRKAVIEAKITLSSEPIAKLDIELAALAEADRYQREIPREVYEQLIKPVLDRTAGPCSQAIAKMPASSRIRLKNWCWSADRPASPPFARWWISVFELSARGKKPHTELNP
jgi:molecular chaperone DnaK